MPHSKKLGVAETGKAIIQGTLQTAKLTAEGTGITEVHAASQQLIRLEKTVSKTQQAVESLPRLAATLRATQDVITQRGSKLPALQRQGAQACKQLLRRHTSPHRARVAAPSSARSSSAGSLQSSQLPRHSDQR